jgi:hypothetical protein
MRPKPHQARYTRKPTAAAIIESERCAGARWTTASAGRSSSRRHSELGRRMAGQALAEARSSRRPRRPGAFSDRVPGSEQTGADDTSPAIGPRGRRSWQSNVTAGFAQTQQNSATRATIAFPESDRHGQAVRAAMRAPPDREDRNVAKAFASRLHRGRAKAIVGERRASRA